MLRNLPMIETEADKAKRIGAESAEREARAQRYAAKMGQPVLAGAVAPDELTKQERWRRKNLGKRASYMRSYRAAKK